MVRSWWCVSQPLFTGSCPQMWVTYALGMRWNRKIDSTDSGKVWNGSFSKSSARKTLMLRHSFIHYSWPITGLHLSLKWLDLRTYCAAFRCLCFDIPLLPPHHHHQLGPCLVVRGVGSTLAVFIWQDQHGSWRSKTWTEDGTCAKDSCISTELLSFNL